MWILALVFLLRFVRCADAVGHFGALSTDLRKWIAEQVRDAAADGVRLLIEYDRAVVIDAYTVQLGIADTLDTCSKDQRRRPM
jgi:hypothetical protein